MYYDKIKFDSFEDTIHFYYIMIESESHIRVRYVETDAMGIAHHSNYIIWLELARVEMMDKLGLPYTEIEKQGALMPVLEVHISYLSPAYFDDRLIIKAFVREEPKVRLKVEYQIFREKTLIATAETLHTFINREGKAIRPPSSFLECMKQHFPHDIQ